MDPEERHHPEQRLAELNRMIAEAQDGYAPGGPYIMKMYGERGRIQRQLDADADQRKGTK